ncbi:MAG TPA: hypothetical protein PLW65_28905 [Pseudomonadota bacterium]|nr:hypothetical protein [Pseudomonadota bacterium]
MPKPSGVITFNKIDGLVQEYNTQWNTRPIEPQSVTAQLCWFRNGVKAEETIFPVSFWGNTAKERNRYEVRKHTPPEVTNFSCPIKEYSPEGEMIAKGTMVTDLYGIFEAKLPMIAQLGMLEPEYRLAEFLGSGQDTVKGVQAYDGLPFFHTAKLVNPNRAAKGNFANFNGSLALNRAGLNTAFQALNEVKGPDGRLFRLPGRKVVVVSTEDQYDRASRELFGTLVSQTSGAAVAGVSNTLMGRADLIYFPDLIDFDGGKGWYVFKIVSAEYRPLVFSQCAPPEIYIEGLEPNAHSRVTRNVINYGWQHFFGFGYGWPQLAYKAVEP